MLRKESVMVKLRTEQEMFDLIINTAKEDERILAVMLNGSRSDPHAPNVYRNIFRQQL